MAQGRVLTSFRLSLTTELHSGEASETPQSQATHLDHSITKHHPGAALVEDLAHLVAMLPGRVTALVPVSTVCRMA